MADRWWPGQGTGNYFKFKSHETAHHFEAGLAYTLPVEKFPLSIAWYTMFAGQDKKENDRGEMKQNYSSYMELNYPFSVKTVDLNVTCGIVPSTCLLYTSTGGNCCRQLPGRFILSSFGFPGTPVSYTHLLFRIGSCLCLWSYRIYRNMCLGGSGK